MRRFRIDRFILSICAIDGIIDTIPYGRYSIYDGIYRFVSSIVSIDLCHRWYLSICIIVVPINFCHRWYLSICIIDSIDRNLRNRDRTDANPDPFRIGTGICVITNFHPSVESVMDLWEQFFRRLVLFLHLTAAREYGATHRSCRLLSSIVCRISSSTETKLSSLRTVASATSCVAPSSLAAVR